MRSPARRSMRDSGGSAWYGGAVKTSRGRARSSASSAVMSLVVLAMARRESAFFANITSPLRPSTTPPAAAVPASGGRAAAPAGAAGSAATRMASVASVRAARFTRSLAQLDLLAGHERLGVELGVQHQEPLHCHAGLLGDPAERVTGLDCVVPALAPRPAVGLRRRSGRGPVARALSGRLVAVDGGGALDDP